MLHPRLCQKRQDSSELVEEGKDKYLIIVDKNLFVAEVVAVFFFCVCVLVIFVVVAAIIDSF